MFSLKENNEELTIRGFPIIMWSICLFLFFFGIYIIYGYAAIFENFSSIIASLTTDISTFLTMFFGLSFMPLMGIVLLYFYPLVTTKVNRTEKIITVERLGILGKRVHKYRFSELKGGFRVKSEEGEDNQEYLKLYFDLNSGKRVFLSSDTILFGKGKVYDVAMKGNNFLQNRQSGSP